MDPELILMQKLAEHLESFGPKTAVKVANAIYEVLDASDGVSPEARRRAGGWALGRASANLALASKADKAADEPERDDLPTEVYVNPSVEAEARAAAGVDKPKRKVVDTPQARATSEGVMEQLRAGHEPEVPTQVVDNAKAEDAPVDPALASSAPSADPGF